MRKLVHFNFLAEDLAPSYDLILKPELQGELSKPM